MTENPLTDKQEITFSLRAPEIESLKAFARLRDHSVEEEIRLALRVHARRMLLSYIGHPRGRDELTSQGYDAGEQEAILRRRLERLEAEAYSLPEGADRLRPHDHLWLAR
jgi:hypothetical protein